MDVLELASSLTATVSSLHKRLRKQMPSTQSLSITETTTLSYLYRHGNLFPSELAELTKIKTQSMSQVLNRLAELLLIQRVPSQHDKRKVTISLTREGKDVVEQSRYERADWLAHAIEASLSKDEVSVLIQSIDILNKLSNFR